MFNEYLPSIKREVKEKIFSKTFIFTTFLIPVIMIGLVFFQNFMLFYDSKEEITVTVFAEDNKIYDEMLSELPRALKEQNIYYDVRLGTKENFKSYVNSNYNLLFNEEIKAAVFLPASVFKEKKCELYARKPNNQKVISKIQRFIDQVVLSAYLEVKNISKEDIEFAKKESHIETFEIKEKQMISKAGYGREVLAFIFAMILYMSLLMNSNLLLQSVVEEKSSKIVEVLLSSINSSKLLLSKIIGSTISALTQMFIWISSILFLASGSLVMLPEELYVDLSFGDILFFLINFAVGIVLFFSLFAAVGSMFDNVQDSQYAVMPLMFLIIIPFLGAIALLQNPDNIFGKVLSLTPIFSVIVMPVRLSLGSINAIHIFLSLAGNIILLPIIIWLAGKIYDYSILISGKKVSINEIIFFLKNKKSALKRM